MDGQLFDPDRPHFDGSTYDPARDHARLTRQIDRVLDYMVRECAHGDWVTLAQVSAALGIPEASVSARIRDLRKPRFGAHTIERLNAGAGLWGYRIDTRPAIPPVLQQQ